MIDIRKYFSRVQPKLVASCWQPTHIHFLEPNTLNYDRMLIIWYVAKDRRWTVAWRIPKSGKPVLGSVWDEHWNCWSCKKIVDTKNLKCNMNKLQKLHKLLGTTQKGVRRK